MFCGSLARPFGGALADRFGGLRTLSFVYAGVGAAFAILTRGVPDVTIGAPILAAAMAALGVGNGSVFQIVPQRFSRNVGVVTGFVGATGGVGGFCLAAGLGYARHFAGTYALGLGAFAALSLAALAAVANVGIRWRRTWLAQPAVSWSAPR